MEKYIVIVVSMQQQVGERIDIVGTYKTWGVAVEELTRNFNETVNGWENADMENMDCCNYLDGSAYAKYEDDEFFWEIHELS